MTDFAISLCADSINEIDGHYYDRNFLLSLHGKQVDTYLGMMDRVQLGKGLLHCDVIDGDSEKWQARLFCITEMFKINTLKWYAGFYGDDIDSKFIEEIDQFGNVIKKNIVNDIKDLSVSITCYMSMDGQMAFTPFVFDQNGNIVCDYGFMGKVGEPDRDLNYSDLIDKANDEIDADDDNIGNRK